MMTENSLEGQIRSIQLGMTTAYIFAKSGVLPTTFMGQITLLQRLYGEYLGRAKAENPELSSELTAMDKVITEYFQDFARAFNPEDCLKKISIAIGKISELVSFVETSKSNPPKLNVSKEAYDALLREKKEMEKTAEFLFKHGNFPEVSALLETAKDIGLPVDEPWVLALCSSNLIEAVVNRKLEKLGEKAEGSFRARYQKLCKIIKEKEGRDIQQLLPIALYEGIRNKLDHASDSNRVTPKEAKDISKMVTEFMNEIFQ